MQLSIEAIIILVIAFVLLGLAIVFVKSFFDGIDIPDPGGQTCYTANDENAITPRSIELKAGQKINKKICVYNNADKEVISPSLRLGQCIDPSGTPAPNVVSLQSLPLEKNIPRGGAVEFAVSFSIANNAAQGTYICNVFAQHLPINPTEALVGPAQFLIEVT